MHIREIHVRNFMLHEDSKVELPDCGVVTVSGPNGAGKTAMFIESVATGAWGKTMRDTPPWMGEKSAVRVVTDKLDILRTKTKNSAPSLTWHAHADTIKGHSTSTKGQADLGAHIRDFDLWCKTHVLTLKESAGFISGTDAKRKEIFETLCGLQAFDVGLQKCREDTKASKATAMQLEGQLGALRERIKGLEARIEDLHEAKAAEAKVAGKLIPPKKLEAARSFMNDALTTEKESEFELRAKTQESAQAEADLGVKEQAAKRLDRDHCPTCAQPIPYTLREELRAQVQAAKEHCAVVFRAVSKASKELKASIASARAEAQEMRDLIERGNIAARDAAQVQANETRRQEKLASAAIELAAAKEKLEKAEAQLSVVRADLAELEIIEKVLGVRGVRVALMDRAMHTVTTIANKWLTRLFPGVSVRVFEEKTRIQVEVHGIQHEHHYKGASSGQRRRLDIAVMFGFAEFAAATFGSQQGTLFLDEVADSLDQEGLAAFAECITEIAKDRCVVLITHNHTLLQGIRAVARFTVTEGKVST